MAIAYNSLFYAQRVGIFDGADCETPAAGSHCVRPGSGEKAPGAALLEARGRSSRTRAIRSKSRASEPHADRRRNAGAATIGSPGYIAHLTASRPLRIGNGVALSKTRRRKAKLWPEISPNLSVQTINGGGTMIIAAAIAITLLSAVLYGMNETFDSL